MQKMMQLSFWPGVKRPGDQLARPAKSPELHQFSLQFLDNLDRRTCRPRKSTAALHFYRSKGRTRSPRVLPQTVGVGAGL
jgi:hypothetical protein